MAGLQGLCDSKRLRSVPKVFLKKRRVFLPFSVYPICIWNHVSDRGGYRQDCRDFATVKPCNLFQRFFGKRGESSCRSVFTPFVYGIMFHTGVNLWQDRREFAIAIDCDPFQKFFGKRGERVWERGEKTLFSKKVFSPLSHKSPSFFITPCGGGRAGGLCW